MLALCEYVLCLLRCCFLSGQWCSTTPFPSRRVNCSSGSRLRILKKPAPVHTWGSGQKQLQTWKELLNSKCRALKHNSRPRWQLTNILHSVTAYQKPPNNTRGWLHVNKELFKHQTFATCCHVVLSVILPMLLVLFLCHSLLTPKDTWYCINWSALVHTLYSESWCGKTSRIREAEWCERVFFSSPSNT